MVKKNTTVALERLLETKEKTNKEIKTMKRKYSTLGDIAMLVNNIKRFCGLNRGFKR